MVLYLSLVEQVSSCKELLNEVVIGESVGIAVPQVKKSVGPVQ